MLVLSRKKGESLVIGGSVVVKVVELGTERVRLGITAPKGVVVDREEVRRRIERQGHDTRMNKALEAVELC